MSPAVFKFARRAGFTMIELIVVMSIFTISVAATIPFLGSFQRTETMETHVQDLLQTLRRAQHRSVTWQRGSSWGVRIQNGAGEFILFSGDSYDTRTTHFDETHKIKGPYTFSGSGEIVFDRATGEPFYGNVKMMLTSESDQSQIDVNPAGNITRTGFGT